MQTGFRIEFICAQNIDILLIMGLISVAPATCIHQSDDLM